MLYKASTLHTASMLYTVSMLHTASMLYTASTLHTTSMLYTASTLHTASMLYTVSMLHTASMLYTASTHVPDRKMTSQAQRFYTLFNSNHFHQTLWFDWTRTTFPAGITGTKDPVLIGSDQELDRTSSMTTRSQTRSQFQFPTRSSPVLFCFSVWTSTHHPAAMIGRLNK